MMISLISFMTCSIFCINLVICEPSVTLSQGQLIGKISKNEHGKEYFSYLGIPYAKPPIGDLRFKPPQKAEPWEEVLNATETRSICSSMNIFSNKLDGDEDCLFLNIFIPNTTSDKKLPVMFWIHGGGFVGGSGNPEYQGPHYLMDFDIILVTINYRLGPFGFLNLELEGAPGNVGLLDQVEALKWIKENIDKFGGDPNDITIAGSSAGAASVHYLLLSHTAAGLFHKAIAQSGSALNPWAFQKYPVMRALQLCQAMDYPTNDTQEALNFLKTASVNKILLAKMPPSFDDHLVTNFIFVPSVEKVFSTHPPFLEETPLARIQSGNFNKVPQIIGFNNGEGNMFTYFNMHKPDMLEQLEADSEKGLPNDLGITRGSDTSKEIAEKVRKYYFGNGSVSENEQKYADLFGHDWFIRGIDRQVKLTVEKQNEPVYYYEYTFSESNPAKAFFGNSSLKGAPHGAELSNIFKLDIAPLELDVPNVVLTQKRMLQLWTNFIKTGTPTPEVSELVPLIWEPATKEKLNYLNIGSTIKLGTNPEEESVSFWESVVKI